MKRRRKERTPEDHTEMAFIISAIFACVVVAVVEDMVETAGGAPLWNIWSYHPVSMFAGTLTFAGLLYLLQFINDRRLALKYLEPYVALLGVSGANLFIKANSVWLLPVLAIGIICSVLQVRRLRERRSAMHRKLVTK
jgi:hypothetical protein